MHERHPAKESASLAINKGLILPAYSGIAFLLSWIYLLFYANSAGIEAAAPISLMGIPYTLSSLVMSIIVLVIAFGSSSFPERIMTGKMKVTSSTGTAIGTLFMIIAGIFDSFWLMMLGAVVTGVFSGILAQQWVIAYRRVGLKTMISSFPALLAVSTGICMTVMYLPRTVILIVTVILPVVSGFLLHSVRKALFPAYDFGSTASDRPLDFAIVLFPIGVFGFASGFLDFFSFQSGYTYFFYMAVTAILLTTACVFVGIANRENAFACIILPMCFFICIFVPFFTMFNHVPEAHFISIGELGIEIALFSIAIGFADFFSINALKTYALCRVVHVLLNSIGWYVGSFSSFALSNMMSSQASLAVVFIGVEVIAVCLIVAIVKAQKTLPQSASATNDIPTALSTGTGLPNGFHDAPVKTRSGVYGEGMHSAGTSEILRENSSEAPSQITGLDQISSAATMESKCLMLGREYGLSNREMDVFALLARGYSAAAIQGELYIAKGTVNYHTRNIYSKLGVHSKQELISMVSDHDMDPKANESTE